MPIANQEMIRNTNRRLVLEYIVNNPPVSRADLAKHLQLTKATISNIVQELLDKNLVQEIGSAQTAMGRKPILLKFHQSSRSGSCHRMRAAPDYHPDNRFKRGELPGKGISLSLLKRTCFLCWNTLFLNIWKTAKKVLTAL